MDQLEKNQVRTMYNEDQKLAFIKTIHAGVDRLERVSGVFLSTAPYERKAGKDFSAMSLKEAQEFVDDFVSTRTQGKYNRLCILRSYVKWCISSKTPGANDNFLHVNVLGLEKVRYSTVSGPAHLNRFLETVFPKPEEETVAVVHCTYLWLAFSGLSEEEALSLRRDQVDINSMTIWSGERAVPIYRESLKNLTMAMTLSEFKVPREYSKKVKFGIRKRVGDPALVLRTTVDKTIKRNIRSQISDAIREYQEENHIKIERLSYRRVWTSGVFYRMSELEKAGLPVNFGPIMDLEKAIGYATSDTDNEKYISGKEHSWEADYNRWKLAFSI